MCNVHVTAFVVQFCNSIFCMLRSWRKIIFGAACVKRGNACKSIIFPPSLRGKTVFTRFVWRKGVCQFKIPDRKLDCQTIIWCYHIIADWTVSLWLFTIALFVHFLVSLRLVSHFPEYLSSLITPVTLNPDQSTPSPTPSLEKIEQSTSISKI